MPLISYIYSASKQISAAVSSGKYAFCGLFHHTMMLFDIFWESCVTDENSNAFKEVAIVRHPRIGEYAFGFITSTVFLQKSGAEEELFCVYVPTNHLYLGDIILINSKDVMRPNLSVQEGIGNSFMSICYNPKLEKWCINFLWLLTWLYRNCHFWGHICSQEINCGGWSSHTSRKNWQLWWIKCSRRWEDNNYAQLNALRFMIRTCLLRHQQSTQQRVLRNTFWGLKFATLTVELRNLFDNNLNWISLSRFI